MSHHGGGKGHAGKHGGGKGKTGLKKSGPGLDKVFAKIQHQLHGHHPKVVVGLLGSHASRGEDGHISNVALGVVHEFGAPRAGVPERSFLRRTFDAKKELWYGLALRLLKKVAADKLDLDTAFGLLGEKMKADIKLGITSGVGIPPPNAPATVKAKGSDRPLVDTGRLVGSIDYEVRNH